MNPNPALGVLFHWLGGLASGSFYVPYKGVKYWAWETYWLAGGFFSWIIAPWILAVLLTNDLFTVLRQAPGSALFWAFFFLDYRGAWVDSPSALRCDTLAFLWAWQLYLDCALPSAR